MKRIVVASTNPTKINSAKQGFEKMFPDEHFEVEGIFTPSGVSNQPMGDKETFTGAQNRVLNAQKEKPDADFWIGIEGGIEDAGSDIEVFAWVVIRSKENQLGKARTSTFFLPPAIAKLVREGTELGLATDAVFGMTNSKHDGATVGALTGNVIDRTAYYVEAVTLALIPFKNTDLYKMS